MKNPSLRTLWTSIPTPREAMGILVLAMVATLALGVPALAGDVLGARLIVPRDGDSYVMEFSTGRGAIRSDVRVIGVDCPEYDEAGGEEAETFARAWFKRYGGEVLIETDQERFDRYHRLLGYVRARSGDRILNLDLVRSGLCRAKNYPPNEALRHQLELAQEAARSEKLGVWAK